MRISSLYQYISYLRFCICPFKAILVCALFFISGDDIAIAQVNGGFDKSKRVITFSEYTWLVKSSGNSKTGTFAPGNNYFSDSRKNVWVDRNGWLHLKITNKNGKWYCAEVTLTKSLGYKKYIFQVNSRVDQFHPNVVGGLFTYLDGTDHSEEIDIEFSKWGNSKNVNNTQYSIQPSDILGNTQSFGIDMNGNESTHVFDWKPGKVDFACYRGHYSSTPTDGTMVINEWNYSGKDVPIDINGKIHINLWLFRRGQINPDDHPEAELVIKSFQAL